MTEQEKYYQQPKRKGINILLVISLILSGWGILSFFLIFSKGLGVLGINNHIFWGVLITNFVFWIGIGHAGTFISAILLLMNQKWRNGIERTSELMTLVAIVLAAMMPVIHLGKPLLFYKMLPVNAKTGFIFTNLISPLSWDFWAILTYLIVSVMFLQIGLLPDFAHKRDRSKGLKHKIYHFLSFGWNHTLDQWQYRKQAQWLMAGIATPLVVSVHSIVSLDFAVSLNPGWHSTIFPLYFVTGALFSGFAMVMVIMLSMEKFGISKFSLTGIQLENINRFIIFLSILSAMIWIQDVYSSFILKDKASLTNTLNKAFGDEWWLYLLMFGFTLIAPQFLWKNSYRKNRNFSMIICILIVTGMWLERFFIVIGSAESKFMSSSFNDYQPTIWSLGVVFGTLGLFITGYLILVKIIPVNSIYEKS